MKKILIPVLTGCMISLSLTGCKKEVLNAIEDNLQTVYIENVGELYTTQVGSNTFVHIIEDLYYDPNTKIVWLKHDQMYSKYCTPYIASNGLPYKYIPETNTLEEMHWEEKNVRTE